MRKFVIIMMAVILCLCISACTENTLPAENCGATSEVTESTSTNDDLPPDTCVSGEDNKEPAETEKGVLEATEGVTEGTESTTVPNETDTEKKPVDTSVETVEKTEENKQPAKDTTSSEKETPSETKAPQTTTPPETKEPEETTGTEEIVIVRPSAAEVSQKVVQYINQYRAEQETAHAAVLPGLTQIAEYRSKQLVTNFAHDTLDEREALAYYQYGKYVDMTKHGFDESYNYYTYGGGEAIAKGNWGGTADEIARKIATGFRNSSGHWSYVGGAKYNYIAVGCTYDPSSCSWYCCVLVSMENYG